MGQLIAAHINKHLIIYQKDINYLNEKYKKNLIFQQDTTLYHVSKVTEEVLKNTSKLKFGPPNSPDLFQLKMRGIYYKKEFKEWSFQI